MSSIGPQLPPHLTKRKRSPEDESPDSPSTKTSRPNNENEIALDGGEESDSDDGYGPSAPKPAAAGPQRPSIGPSLPPTTASASNTDEIALGSDSDDDDTGPAPPPKSTAQQQPRRVMGPAPPPADLAERPTTAPDADPEDSGSDSDSDDGYGPALPGAAPSRNQTGPSLPHQPAAPAKPARDDWMLAPPEPTGYQERDPTKIKARKFASGTSATSRPSGGAGGGISSIWTETPEEKAKRLADAVLGRGSGADEKQQQQQQAAAAASRSGGGGSNGGGQQDKIRAFTEQTRGKSLVEQHQAAKKAGGGGSGSSSGKKTGGDEEEDDDPSKRAFDREKDMGLGMKITASQRKELLNRASDFGGRFQKGNYL